MLSYVHVVVKKTSSWTIFTSEDSAKTRLLQETTIKHLFQLSPRNSAKRTEQLMQRPTGFETILETWLKVQNRIFEKPEPQCRNPEDREGFETIPTAIYDQTTAEKERN